MSLGLMYAALLGFLAGYLTHAVVHWYRKGH